MKTQLKRNLILSLAITSVGFIAGCGGNESPKTPESSPVAETAPAPEAPAENVDPMSNKGIGPVSSLELAALDPKLAEEGEKIFKEKCSACHKVEEKYVGPAVKGVTTRRTPEWIMNMILNPTEMTEKDPIAKDLLAQFLSPMANQNLKEEEARKVLEYFRSVDSK